MGQHYAFTAKLWELSSEYGKMLCRLKVCQGENHQDILRELDQLRKEIQETEVALQKNVASAHSAGVSNLSKVQSAYLEESRQILQNLWTECSDAEARAEASILYAEYAVDFATQAMKHAVLAALSAVDLQMRYEGGENCNE